MKVESLSCLLIDNLRSRAYLQKLLRSGLEPGEIILLALEKSKPPKMNEVSITGTTSERIKQLFQEREYLLYSKTIQSRNSSQRFEQYRSFDPDESLDITLNRANLPFRVLQVANINDQKLQQLVSSLTAQYVLFSGGGILGKEILSLGKKFIHIHPGLVPLVRGSMAVEWSILVGVPCAASAFFMVPQIDQGEVIKTKIYSPPCLEFGNIPALYSPHIRSELLVEIVQEAANAGGIFYSKPQLTEGANTYYKMHPLLSEIVFAELHQAVGTIL